MPRRTEPDPLSESVGGRIRALREEIGLTQEKLAWDSGACSKSFLSDAERGKSAPSIKVLSQLAQHLKVQLFDFFCSTEGGNRAGTKADLRNRLLDRSRGATEAQLRKALKQLRE